MIKKNGSKKAISPVIATVLLVTIAIVVVAVIFIWASKSIGDKKTKFDGPISDACGNINIDVSLSETSVDVLNNDESYGLYSLALKDSDGDLHECGALNLSPGQSQNILLSSCEADGLTIESAIPVLLDDEQTPYNCEKDEILLS